MFIGQERIYKKLFISAMYFLNTKQFLSCFFFFDTAKHQVLN